MIYLRAHHGLCLSFFKGEGYSNGFTDNMRNVLNLMSDNPELRIISEKDVICSECPNLTAGKCKTFDLVKSYDSKVLSLCGINESDELCWKDFSALVYEKIIAAGKREEVCGDCEWSDICK